MPNAVTRDYEAKILGHAVYQKLQRPICAGERLTATWPGCHGERPLTVTLLPGDVQRLRGRPMSDVVDLIRKRLER